MSEGTWRMSEGEAYREHGTLLSLLIWCAVWRIKSLIKTRTACVIGSTMASIISCICFSRPPTSCARTCHYFRATTVYLFIKMNAKVSRRLAGTPDEHTVVRDRLLAMQIH
jgi:hypothetical protein